MSDFTKLQVWRKAHALALNVHAVAIRDIKAISVSGYTSPFDQTIEVKKMLQPHKEP